MPDVKKVLDKNWQYLQKIHPGVLNVGEGTKIKNGIDTGIKCITVYVEKKLPLSEIIEVSRIPKEISGVLIDVIEIKHDSWKAGKTGISQLHPDIQKRLASGVKPSIATYTAMPKTQTPRPLNVEADHRKLVGPTRDQGGCGYCTAFGNIGVWEPRHKQLYGEMIELSEKHLGSCSGCTCNGGNTVEATLNQAMKGVCLRNDLPYDLGNGIDKKCGDGLPTDWYLRGKKLKSWEAIIDFNDMLTVILLEPMNSTMTVHNSFFNYRSGVYKNLGTSDPIAGYHDIGILGASDILQAWLLRNSWLDWGDEGYCWIAYGDSKIDRVMYRLEPSNEVIPQPDPDPNPNPDPIPSKCPWSNGIASSVQSSLNTLSYLTRRDTRYSVKAVRPKGNK